MEVIPKISIIVPVYNAGIYLERCLDTLVNQTLKDIEIILILDCPTDGSDRIAKEYVTRDSRIILIENKQNLNIGLSRNEGLKVAKGEYIGFADHDDYCDLTMYECMYNKAKEGNFDIVVTPPCLVSGEKEHILFYPNEYSDDLRFKLFSLTIGYDKNEDLGNWKDFAGHGDMWDKIYRRSLVVDNNIQFVDNRKTTFEDLLFIMNCFFYSKKVGLINKSFYYHVYYDGNTLGTYFYFSPELIVDFLTQLHTFLLKKHLFDIFKIRFEQTVINNIVLSFMNEISNKGLGSLRPFINKIRKSFILEAFRHQPIILGKNLCHYHGITQLLLTLYSKFFSLK